MSFQRLRRCVAMGAGADNMEDLRRREKEMGIEPDYQIDAFMKASQLRNRRQHIMTDYMLRLLGLEVSSEYGIFQHYVMS